MKFIKASKRWVAETKITNNEVLMVNNDKMRVLDLLEAGKISHDEAAQLLSVLDSANNNVFSAISNAAKDFFKPKYPISTQLRELIRGKVLTKSDLEQARGLLKQFVDIDECNPFTRERACAYEVVILLHENKYEQAFETAAIMAEIPDINHDKLRGEINFQCYSAGFKREYNMLFVRRV